MLKRIGNITLMCAFALAALSCSRPDEVPDTPERKTPIDFAPTSRDVATKAGPLSAYHDDFGVWGIARPSDAALQDYVLWESAAMSKVVKSQTDDAVYTPVEDAFWLGGHTYDFIAVAPWEAAGALPSGAIIPGTESGTDRLTFTCSLADKYTAGTYAFDLMAAVAQTTVGTPRTEAQDLEFYHLFSKICISVEFSGMTGTVKGMHLYNVDTDLEYTVLFDENKKIKVDYTLEDQAEEALKDIDYIADNASPWVLHIVPQYITDFELYLDYEIGGVSVKNFEVNLAAAKATPEYHSNQWYNWKIKITPKAITFDVTVQDWVDEDDDFKFELQ